MESKYKSIESKDIDQCKGEERDEDRKSSVGRKLKLHLNQNIFDIKLSSLLRGIKIKP